MLWLSIDAWLITAISLAYLILLFMVAHWGQQQTNKKWASNPWVYSLSLGVSCTSWAFYGIIGQASATGQWLAPIYIGTIGFFILAWPVLLKILRVSKQQNLTSIADFIACRYEKAPIIAAFVSIIALLGTIPYIALQLRAISQSFDLVTGSYDSGTSTTFVVTVVLIGFSILFGARSVAVNRQNQGLVFAIAFSSIVKLFAITAIGIFTTYFLFDGFTHIISHQSVINDVPNEQTIYLTLAQIILGAMTIFITPQLYHMIIIENNDEKSLIKARWLYPLYLILINIFVLPIAIAGLVTFPGGSVNTDTFILTIPLFHQQVGLSLMVYIGGLAAATSMVIIAAIVLSNMLTTELITPLFIRVNIFKKLKKTHLAQILLSIRRYAIAAILLFGFAFEQLVSQQHHLSNLGLLAFVLLVQVGPAVIGALYWKKASSVGAIVGLLAGTLIWAYTLLLPTLWPNADWIEHGMFNQPWLKPEQLFGITLFDSISHGVFLSLAINIFCFIIFSIYLPKSVGEKLQADLFIKKQSGHFQYKLTVDDLVNLLRRFIDNSAADELINLTKLNNNNQSLASLPLIEFTQKRLASVLGSASTRLVMKVATSDDNADLSLAHVANIVDEANQLFEFNRELLQAAVENVEQGISVVDADMNLVAWNTRYIQLLDYPPGFLKAGMHISQLLQFNVERGIIEGLDLDSLITRRISHMQAGNNHYFQRTLPNGIVIEIRGQAMPGGGFVSTFSDITKHIEAEKALQKANESLEQRVIERTQELAEAKSEAEMANRSKTRFLAAASHDLMQPFNALSLFTDMLKQQAQGSKLELIADQIQASLGSVEALLSDLVEISKLDSQAQKIENEPFALDDILSPLSAEIDAMCAKEGVQFTYVKTSTWVNTDKRLLRRVIQNLLTNAIYYTPYKPKHRAKVVLGVKRKNGLYSLSVYDNGPGIAENKQQLIFKEFERLELNREKPGLGLGLAISNRIATLLQSKLSLKSTLGIGSIFSIALQPERPGHRRCSQTAPISRLTNDLADIHVLLIDNDELLLTALQEQLVTWGCKVLTIKNYQQWQQRYESKNNPIELVIADYHLDNKLNGVTLVETIFQETGWRIPCIVISADYSEHVRQHCSDAGFSFIKKPVKALALKRLMKQIL